MIHIEGVVIHGNSLGRTIGFPTANISLASDVVVDNGVYYSEVVVDGESYRAMTNVGVRPTVGGEQRLVETHILDFSASLYDKRIIVTLYEKIRDEQKFPSLAALREQLAADADYVRRRGGCL